MTDTAVVYAARRVLAIHRPIPLSDGYITEHEPPCQGPGQGEGWYELRDASDPELADPEEVWAAHYGPACREPKGWPQGAAVCVECMRASDGQPQPYPCWYARCALVAQAVSA